MGRIGAAIMVCLISAVAAPVPGEAGALFAVASYRASSSSEPRVPPASSGAQRMTDGVDRPDTLKGRQTHAIYFVPRDRRDEHLDASGGFIARALDGVGGWFRYRMGKAPRFDRTRRRVHDITFVRGAAREVNYDFASIVTEVRASGYDAANKRYAIFAAVGQGSTCGESQYPFTPEVSVGRFLVIWLDSAETCGARDVGRGTAASAGRVETILAHEWLHTEGVVPMLAPRHCSSHAYHACTAALWVFPAMDPEAHDVMFPYAGLPLREKVLDRDRDDYLDHGLPHVRNLRASVYLA